MQFVVPVLVAAVMPSSSWCGVAGTAVVLLLFVMCGCGCSCALNKSARAFFFDSTMTMLQGRAPTNSYYKTILVCFGIQPPIQFNAQQKHKIKNIFNNNKKK